jgi:hypothetical protein
MSDLYGDSVVEKRIIVRPRNGDQEIISFDLSLFREFSASFVPLTSPIAALVGNQLVMKGWSHNCSVNVRGEISPRDDPGGCGLWCYVEDETIRYFGAPAGLQGSSPVFTLYYTYNMLTGASTYVGPIIPSQTVGITGTTTNNSAQAGAIGEVISATIATPGTSLTTATPANVITTPFLALTAGDWDIWGEICFLPAATTSITQLAFGINSVSATLPAANSGLVQSTFTAFVPTAIPQCGNVTARRVSLSAPTTYYLVAQAAFTVSTLSAFGTLYARRRR